MLVPDSAPSHLHLNNYSTPTLPPCRYQNSRYAYQVERFACLYTSHVSNMNYYSPLKSHRGRLDSMAHDDEGPCEL